MVAEARGVVLYVSEKSGKKLYGIHPAGQNKSRRLRATAERINIDSANGKGSPLPRYKIPKPDDAADALAVAITHSQTNTAPRAVRGYNKRGLLSAVLHQRHTYRRRGKHCHNRGGRQIGYEILATNSAIVNLPPIGKKEAKLYVFLSVKKKDGMEPVRFQEPRRKEYVLLSYNGFGRRPQACNEAYFRVWIYPRLPFVVINGRHPFDFQDKRHRQKDRRAHLSSSLKKR